MKQFLEQYKQLAVRAEKAFRRVQALHPDLVQCRIGCCDCCFAFFELTPLEAYYLHEQFRSNLDPRKQEEVLQRARGAEVEYRRIQERLRRMTVPMRPSSTRFLHQVGRQRLACPLLNDEDRCDLYSHRPITCRVYGVPLRIAGEARTCGLSGFRRGGAYPTVDLDSVMDRLLRWSEEFMEAMGRPQWRRDGPLISVSSALLGRFLDRGRG